MAWADLAVTAGWDYLGNWHLWNVLLITIVLSENQVAVTDSLAKAGAAYNLRWHHLISENDLALALTAHLFSKEKRSLMSESGKVLVDGNGVESVAQLLSKTDLYCGQRILMTVT